MFNRKTHWETVYRNKSPTDLSWFQTEPALSLQLIRNTNISADDPIIDVGGGASSLVDFLCQQGYRHVSVLDVSANALDILRQRLGDKASAVDWFVEDITRFDPPHTFSLWHDRAVFHFLTDQGDRRNYVAVLKRALKPDGHVIIATFAIGGPTKCSGLDIVQYNAEKLMAELGAGFDLMEAKTEVHITPAKKEQKFAWFRLRRNPETMATSG